MATPMSGLGMAAHNAYAVSTAGKAAGATAVNPFLGFGITIAATLIDQLFLMPKLRGKGRQQAQPDRLFDLPASSLATGSPRIWAMGRRVRTPAHVAAFWKREMAISTGSAKVGRITRREVFGDGLIVLNDRQSRGIVQLLFDGRVAYWNERNLVTVRTSDMTASTPGSGRLRLTMNTLQELDFTHRFVVGDVVRLRHFHSPTGVNGYWRVQAIVGHSVTAPSSVTLDPLEAQAAAAATPGSALTPAIVERVDDAIIVTGYTGTVVLVGTVDKWVRLTNAAAERNVGEVFRTGDDVMLTGWSPSSVNGRYRVARGILPANQVWLIPYGAGAPTLPAVGTGITCGAPNAQIQFYSTQRYYPGLFGADPVFRRGTEDEGEDATIAEHEPTGTIPGFRGQATLSFRDLNLTDFGNRAPNVEVIQEVDESLTWAQAIARILERHGLTQDDYDVSLVPTDQCEGYYLRGVQPTTTALQPLLVAKQVATQERDARVAFFPIERADVVRIRNGAAFSDFGANGAGGPKYSTTRQDVERLPTALDVSHQDPDSSYGEGVQPAGLRAPLGVEHENAQQLHLDTLVLTRQQARNLAGTVVRRTWLNSHAYDMLLPASYCHLLENDLLTWTDDAGEVHLARATRVEVGSNFTVRVRAVRETLDAGVTGSPVQSGSGSPPVIVPPPTEIAAEILDMPPLIDEHAGAPGLYLCAGARRGGHWAGVRVYESTDGGTNYSLIGTLDGQSTIGFADTALPDGSPSEEVGNATPTWDTTSTVDITLESDGLIPLVTMTQAQVRDQRFNWAILGNEIIGFATVTALGGNSYRLSTLLRGLRRTVPTGHVVGERFVLLYHGTPVFLATGMFRSLSGVAQPEATLHYKFVPTGRTLVDVQAMEFDLGAWNARPFPPYDISSELEPNNDVLFSITEPHTRRNLPVAALPPFPFDESFEEYVWRVYADGTYGAVVATLTRTSRGPNGTGSPRTRDRSILYTAVEQADDMLTPGATLYYDVRHIGDHGESRAVRATT